MNNTENNTPEFKDKTEALEFMVKRSVDKKRKEKWAKDFAEGRKKTEKATVIPIRRRIIQISSIAAIFILGFAIIQFLPLQTQNLESLASNMIDSTKFLPNETTRGTAASDEEISKMLQEALESENYQKALTIYEQMSEPMNTENKFFYAVSLAKTNSSENEKILELTSGLLQSENEFFIESLWLRALTHLKLKDAKSAKLELEQLHRYKYQTKNVEKLLSKISS